MVSRCLFTINIKKKSSVEVAQVLATALGGTSTTRAIKVRVRERLIYYFLTIERSRAMAI